MKTVASRFAQLLCLTILFASGVLADDKTAARVLSNEDVSAINAQFNIQPSREITAHKGDVTSVSLSHDGKLLLTAGDSGAVVLWNTTTGERVRQFGDTSLGKINCVLLSPDGKFALAGGEEKTIWLWDAATGKELRKFPLDTTITVLAWSPDAAKFASSGADQNLRVFDRESGKELRNDHQIIQPSALTFSFDGKHVFIGLPPEGLGHLRIEGTEPARWIYKDAMPEIPSIAIKPQGDRLAVPIGKKIYLLDLKLDEATQMYAPATGLWNLLTQPPGVKAAVVADGSVAVYFSGDGAIDMRTTALGRRRLYRSASDEGISATAISGDARTAASADKTGKIRIWPLGDPPADYKTIVDDFHKNLNQLFRDEKFAEIDALAADLNKRQPDFPWGESMLHVFYVAINGRIDQPGFDYDKEFAMYDRWFAAQPNTGAGRIARGGVTVRYAWSIRGGAAGLLVPQERYAKFEEELRKAKELLNAGLRNTPNDPEAYTWLIVAGNGLGDDKKEMFDLADKSLKVAPRYNRPLAMMCGYLAPRWHGEPGEAAKYCLSVIEKLGGDDGKEMYVNIAINQFYVDGDSIFGNGGFSWPVLKEGGEVLLRRHPLVMQSQLNLVPSFMARAATINDDRETAKKYFDILAGFRPPPIWRDQTEFQRSIDWANTDEN